MKTAQAVNTLKCNTNDINQAGICRRVAGGISAGVNSPAAVGLGSGGLMLPFYHKVTSDHLRTGIHFGPLPS